MLQEKWYLNILVLLLILYSCSSGDKANPKLSIGSFEKATLQPVFEFAETDSIMFQNINAVKFGEHDNVLVQDFRLQYITMLDQQGNVLQKIGRKGRGPAEFVLIGSFITSDDELMITDRVTHKIELFDYRDSVYQHKMAINFEDQESSGIMEGVVEDGILIRRGSPIAASQQKFSPIRLSTISLINREGELTTDSIATYSKLESLVSESGEFFSMVKTFGNRGFEAFNGEDKIYTLWSDSLSIDYYTLDGQKRHVFSYGVQPVQVTSAERDSILKRREDPQKSVLEKQFPEAKPLVNAMLLDDQHRFWVELNARDLGNRWFVFENDGSPLYAFDKPHPSAEIQDVTQDKVLWNYVNEEGIPTVVMAKVVQ